VIPLLGLPVDQTWTPARVEPFIQALDCAALACGIPTFECDDATPTLDPVNSLELEHRDLQLDQLVPTETPTCREPSRAGEESVTATHLPGEFFR
jgi:hypothetical protein